MRSPAPWSGCSATSSTSTFPVSSERRTRFGGINQGMSLDGFKAIFWFEYTHRLLGRMIGLVFAIPFAYFLIAGKVDRGLGLRLAGVFVLGGLQGLLGWYMVMSGLVDRPDVSHYRLTAHLGLAVIIYGTLIWLALSVLVPAPDAWGDGPARGFRTATYASAGAAFLLILSGGLVAGLDAGFAYNTFPKMDDAWIPPGMMDDPFSRRQPIIGGGVDGGDSGGVRAACGAAVPAPAQPIHFGMVDVGTKALEINTSGKIQMIDEGDRVPLPEGYKAPTSMGEPMDVSAGNSAETGSLETAPTTIPFRPETAPLHGGVKLAEFLGFLGVYERISGNGDAPFGALAPILRIRLCGPICTTKPSAQSLLFLCSRAWTAAVPTVP